MSFTSNEINYLIWRYLRESGFEHTAFVFGHESELNDCSITSSDLPSGSLVSIVQRGLFYIDAEVKAYNNELPTESGDESPCKMSLIDGAVYLSRILNDTSDSSVVPPPSPSDSGRPEVETAASTSSMAVNADNLSISPSQSSENVAGVDGLPPYGPERAAEIFRDYILNRMARSGPLESLPSFNVPVISIPQYELEERKDSEDAYQVVGDSTAVLSFPQQSQQPRNWKSS